MAAAGHPVPAMTLHYDDAGRAAVVMEHLDGAPLSALAASGDDRFAPVLGDVAGRLAVLTTATAVPAAGAEAAQALQTPGVTAAWARDVAAALAPWAGSAIWLNGRPLGLTPGQVTRAALRLAGQPPAVLALSSGDLHLGNILVAPRSQRWHLIDLEFAGLHDPDRVTAGLLASLLKHARLITSATADTAGGEILVTARLRDDLAWQLLGTPSLFGALAAGACDPARVFAFMAVSLRFRLAAGPPGALPPAFALAMLALAARMTGQDRP
ncbi:MAG: phosphotransferase [Trebonia sp.]